MNASNRERAARILVATGNPHKLAEIRAILGPGLACGGLTDLLKPPPAVEETASSFGGNALLKASTLAHWLARGEARPQSSPFDWVLADDSGLEVDALNGAPGVRSARFATSSNGPQDNSPDAANNLKLLELLKDIKMAARTARFRCVIALVPLTPLSKPRDSFFFEGCCEGFIRERAAGLGGFGYDPLFQPQGESRTFSEMDDASKNRISHRGEALRQLARWFKAPRPNGAE